MNIIHVSKINDLLSRNYEVIFVFYSEEALDALLIALHNNGVTCCDNISRITYDPGQYSIPRAIRVNKGRATTGSIGFYTDHWPSTKQYRVVL
jgi:hypothetical protein